MDFYEKNLVNPLNTINDIVTEKNRKKWAAKASSECYKNKIEKLNSKMKIVKEDNKRIDNDIKELTPQGETLDNIYRILKESLHTSQETVLILNIYQECAKDMLEKEKKEGDQILEEYTQHYEKRKEKLEKTNPTFQILNEKRIELEKSEFNIKKYQHEIHQQELKKIYKLEILQKLFYVDCISLAKAWLNKKNYDESVKRLEETKNKGKSLFEELIKLNLKIKEKEKINTIYKSVPTKTAENTLQKKLLFAVPAPPKNVPPQNYPKTANQMSFLVPPPNKPQTSINNQHQRSNQPNYFHESNKIPPIANNPANTKIKILENKVVQPPKNVSIPEKEITMSREKSHALKSQLEKVVLNFKARRMSQSGRSMSQICIKPNAEMEEKKIEAETKAEVPSNSPPKLSQNALPESGVTQELQNLNVLSQDGNILSLLSQEAKLKEFQYEPERPRSEKKLFNHGFRSQNEKFANNGQDFKETKTNTEEKSERKANVSAAKGPYQFSMDMNENESHTSFKTQQTNVLNDKTFSRQFTQKLDDNKLGNNPFKALQDIKFNSNEKKSQINNNINIVPQFPNNSTKESENLAFKMNMSFAKGTGMNNFKPEVQKNNFVQNTNNSLKRQKLSQQEPESEPSKLGASMDIKNVAPDGQNGIEKAAEDIQYNFGIITQFMETSSEMGNFNSSYAMSPPDFNASLAEIPDQQENHGIGNIGIPFSGSNFIFDQQPGGFSFNFN